MSENISNQSREMVMAGTRTVELIRPLQDTVIDISEPLETFPIGQITDIYLARESGPCGGVEMAENVLDLLIEERDRRMQSGEKPFEIHANHPPSKGADRAVMYKQAGVSFGAPIEEVPAGSVYLFSAHGADPREVEKAERAGLKVVDTTCPFVGHIYRQVERFVANEPPESRETHGVVYVAPAYKSDHPEVRGTRGVVEKAGLRFIPVTSAQEAIHLSEGGENVGPESASISGLTKVLVTGLTTNNSEVTEQIAQTFSFLAEAEGQVAVEPYDTRSVCKTVSHRQRAVREMVRGGQVETIIVVGALDSNNTNELVGAALDEVSGGESLGLQRIVFANTAADIPELNGSVGIVSGASTQDANIRQIVQRLNVTDEAIHMIGNTDKGNKFRPMGGRAALARLALDGDFDWIT